MTRPGKIKSGDRFQICPRREYTHLTSACKNSLFFIPLLVLLVYPGLSGAADITVHTDRNPAVLQESFQLIFEAVGGVDDDPDFSPLEKDFQVLSTSTSTSMNIVGTKITRTKQWRLTLMPVKAGNLVIPAIYFGKDKSPPASLTVVQAGTGAPGRDAPDIFIDVEASPGTAYVQAEVMYKVKLYRAVATSNETLSEPDVGQGSAIIELLDADRSYDTFVRAGVTPSLKEATRSIPRSAASCRSDPSGSRGSCPRPRPSVSIRSGPEEGRL